MEIKMTKLFYSVFFLLLATFVDTVYFLLLFLVFMRFTFNPFLYLFICVFFNLVVFQGFRIFLSVRLETWPLTSSWNRVAPKAEPRGEQRHSVSTPDLMGKS